MASEASHEPDRQEAAFLKRLQTIPFWRGKVVHEYIQHIASAIRHRGTSPPLNRVIGDLQKRIEADFNFSQQRLYMKKSNGPGLALFEHEYARPLESDVPNRVSQEVVAAMTTFLSRPKLFDRFKEPLTSIEHRIISALEGTKLVGQLDSVFVWRGSLYVIDLKVQRVPDDHRMQLQVYAYLMLRQTSLKGYRPDHVKLYDWDLLNNVLTEHAFDQARYDETEDFIRSSVREMRSVVGNGQYRPEVMGDFALTAEPKYCEFCSFERLCTRLRTGEQLRFKHASELLPAG
jgi:CRISPR/Cas system-associated exonuclease Cas4 (RecB family)